MKKIQSLGSASVLAVFLSVGLSLSAQTTAPSQSAPAQSAPGSQTQPAPPDSSTSPAAPDAQAPASKPEQAAPTSGQTPDQANKPSPEPKDSSNSSPGTSTTPSASAADAQSFSGTIVKSGEKYMFKDEASGNTYDIDHQDEVQKFEGKRVKVKGTLDASSKTIHVQ